MSTSYLRQTVGPRLEDDHQDSDRDGDLPQLELVGQPGPHGPSAALGHLLDPGGERVELGRCDGEAADERAGEPGPGRVLEVDPVRVHDVRLADEEQLGHVVEDLRALGRGERLEHPAALPSCTGNGEKSTSHILMKP